MVGDTYHIFYQHYPDDTKWGPMHWGHAVTKDFRTYEELEIALYPTEEEYIFSGSAILDEENISGLGIPGCPAMLLFYTSHNPKTGEQMQSMAYSIDYIHFEKYEGNPLISNGKGTEGYQPDFRDPKVFRNAIKGGYTMALAAGDHIEFWHSMDLYTWKRTGDFFPGQFGYGGLCECPDLIELTYQGKNLSVLSMSMVGVATENHPETHTMQYFIGEFDGDVFQNGQDFVPGMCLDFGADNYAMVSFGGTKTPLVLGWGEDWNYARVNTSATYFGKMTLPRQLTIKDVSGKYYISQRPVVTPNENTDKLWYKEVTLAFQQTLSLPGNMRIENKGEYLCINDKKIPRVLGEVECNLCIFYDCGYYEIFADGGIISYSQNT